MIRLLCALLMLCGVSSSTSADSKKPLTTMLLVARAELRDPNFKDSIVLVMNHIGPGPTGVIINRPTRIPVSRLLPEVERLARLDDKVYFGGPVAVDSVSFLFRAGKPPEQATEVLDGIYVSTDLDLLRELLGRDKPMEGLRVFIGHSGWARGQLEAEIARGDWTIAPADANAIFDSRPEHPWPERQHPGAVHRASHAEPELFKVPRRSTSVFARERPGGSVPPLDPAKSDNCHPRAYTLLHENGHDSRLSDPAPRGSRRAEGRT